MRARIIFHGIAVLVLLAAVTEAQTPQKARQAPTGPSGRESSAPSVSERETGSGLPTGKRQHEPISASVTARETGSGVATGRKSGSIIILDNDQAAVQASGQTNTAQHDSLNARNSAHATESLDDKKMSQGQSNPMYKDSGKQGTNPLYESKDRSAAPPHNGSGSEVIEYKDGEDGTTHTRPGNHKPAK